jgi:ATP-dependent exoDNAse (exonuclease V) alpha subunit
LNSWVDFTFRSQNYNIFPLQAPQTAYSDLKGFFPFEPTPDQDQLLRKLAVYLSIKRLMPEVFIIKGYAGTGKTTVMRSVVAMHAKHHRKIALLAPTGRAAKVLSGATGAKAHTIHRSLYRPKMGSAGLAGFVLANNTKKNTTYIVDEAGLIGTTNDPTLGGNSLLEDLLSFVFSDPSNNLILVGDPAQLPPIGQPESPALSASYFTEQLFINSTEHTLRQVVRQALDSFILKSATALRNLIEADSSDDPILEPGADLVRVEDGYALQEIFESLYSRDVHANTMVVRSNAKANKYNQGIRARIKFYEDQITAGDQFMVVKNNYFWLPESSKMGFIANGEIGMIKSIRNVHERYGLTFCEATITFVDYPEEDAIDTMLNLSALSSEGPALTGAQSNHLYEQMNLKYERYSNKGKRYEAIKNDPYYNALQIKFSYVITCHKSQGGQWEHVVIEHPYLPDGPSPIYFKWLYTALTRATTKAYLVGFPENWFGAVSLQDENSAP